MNITSRNENARCSSEGQRCETKATRLQSWWVLLAAAALALAGCTWYVDLAVLNDSRHQFSVLTKKGLEDVPNGTFKVSSAGNPLALTFPDGVRYYMVSNVPAALQYGPPPPRLRVYLILDSEYHLHIADKKGAQLTRLPQQPAGFPLHPMPGKPYTEIVP